MPSPTHTLVTYLGGPKNLLTDEIAKPPPVQPIAEYRGAYVLDEDGITYRWHVRPIDPPTAHVRPIDPPTAHVRPADIAGSRTRSRRKVEPSGSA